MRADQCISVTELSKNTSGIIRSIPESGTRYVFVNNKPQAVILSMAQYEALENILVEFGEVDIATLAPETQSMIERSRGLSKSTFVGF